MVKLAAETKVGRTDQPIGKLSAAAGHEREEWEFCEA
jgi:hypothetical protein